MGHSDAYMHHRIGAQSFVQWLLFSLVQSHWPLNNWVIFFQNIISFPNDVQCKCNISAWNWSNTMNILLALWELMAWCFSTKVSVVTLLKPHQCVFSYLGINWTCTDSLPIGHKISEIWIKIQRFYFKFKDMPSKIFIMPHEQYETRDFT